MESHAVVIKKTPYQDRKNILTLLTLEHGLISCLIQNRGSKDNLLTIIASPFSEALFTLNKKNSLYVCKEATLVDAHLHLRESLPAFQSAAKLLKALLISQPRDKPIPHIFQLFLIYYVEIKNTDNPLAIAASFYLKILLIEGLLHLDLVCTLCKKNPSTSLSSGQSFCKTCFPEGSLDKESFKTIYQLTTTKSLQELKLIQVTQTLLFHIEKEFLTLLN